jgi:DNA-binding response OmpR family regulator
MRDGRPVQTRRGGRREPAGRSLALLVENDVDSAEFCRCALEMLGWEVVVAHTGEDALFALANCPPDLVVLDMCLPDIDGVGVLRVVRRLTSTRDVPVVVAGAVFDPRGHHARRMSDLGAPDFLTKPFGLRDLERAVDTAVAAADARRRWNANPGGRSTPDRPAVRRANLLFEGRAVEVGLEARQGRTIVLRSWAETLPEGSRAELEVSDPELGRIRVSGCIGSVQRADIGAGWTALLVPRIAVPAEGFEGLLSSLVEIAEY